MREGSEHRAARCQHPYFIAVPHRANRVDDGAAFFVFFAQEGQQDADSVIEAFQKEEADEQDGDQDKPDSIEIHDSAPKLVCRRGGFFNLDVSFAVLET